MVESPCPGLETFSHHFCVLHISVHFWWLSCFSCWGASWQMCEIQEWNKSAENPRFFGSRRWSHHSPSRLINRPFSPPSPVQPGLIGWLNICLLRQVAEGEVTACVSEPPLLREGLQSRLERSECWLIASSAATKLAWEDVKKRLRNGGREQFEETRLYLPLRGLLMLRPFRFFRSNKWWCGYGKQQQDRDS